MKVLMLTTNSSLLDGINRHILTVAPALNRQDDMEVAVCTVLPKGELNEKLEANGVKTYSLNAPDGHYLPIISRYYRVMKDYDPDVVHIHVMAIMARIAAAIFFRNKKYVKTIHGICDKVTKVTFKMRMEAWMNRIFDIRYSAVCFISKGVKNARGDNFKCDSIVSYNPLDFGEAPSCTYALHRIIGVSGETPVIGTSCRIADVKQPEKFTEVMCRVLQSVPEAHAVVMGDGDRLLIDACRQIVADYGMENRFHWLGYRNDAPQLVQDLDCFVMTSVSEGMPTSIIECMALKTPFAFLEGKGGLEDIASFNTEDAPIAVQTPEDDLQGLADGIVKLLKDKKLALEYTERAWSVGKRNFDIQSVAAQLTGLYKRL